MFDIFIDASAQPLLPSQQVVQSDHFQELPAYSPFEPTGMDVFLLHPTASATDAGAKPNNHTI